MKLERFLTETDRALLDSYAFQCERVKDYTVACVRGTHTGMMLFGAGGNGKSYSIRETLKERKLKEIQPEDTMVDDDAPPAPPKEFGHDTWVNHQGRITPKGLVTAMDQFPKSLHLIEDAETVFDDKNCWGVLRMALHSQDHSQFSPRRITWKTSVAKGSFDFWFTGSLVIVGNRVLAKDKQEIEAVKTRCPSMDFDISNQQLIAKMKELCLRGYKEIQAAPLSSDDCFNVLEFMLTSREEDEEVKKVIGGDKKLNLRLLISGFRFMALGRLEPSISWREMLMGQMTQQVDAHAKTRAERIHDERKIAKEFSERKWTGKDKQHQKLVEWCKLTGRDLAWSDQPRDSEEYARGFNAAKTDLSRKSK